MDDNNVKRELFACCITDGILDDMNPERRLVMIIDITEIKESILKAGDNTPNETKELFV